MHWRLKIFLKIILSRLPIPYGLWSTLKLFRHGAMKSFEYPQKIFNLHFQKVSDYFCDVHPVIMEIGPGDSVASAILGHKHHAQKIYLVDEGDFATKDVGFYKELSSMIRLQDDKSVKIDEFSDFDHFLINCNAEYLTNGLESLKTIPSGSVDFIWSHSVLEHVRLFEIDEFLSELYRVLKKGGFVSHNIDYQDHLAYSLNNLRFSEKTWESDLFAQSGFYTNRIPAVIMHQKMRAQGFKILEENFGKWPCLPIPRDALDEDFRKFSNDQLINRTSSILMTK